MLLYFLQWTFNWFHTKEKSSVFKFKSLKGKESQTNKTQVVCFQWSSTHTKAPDLGEGWSSCEEAHGWHRLLRWFKKPPCSHSQLPKQLSGIIWLLILFTYWLQENTDYPQESVLFWNYIYLCKLITRQSSSTWNNYYQRYYFGNIILNISSCFNCIKYLL